MSDSLLSVFISCLESADWAGAFAAKLSLTPSSASANVASVTTSVSSGLANAGRLSFLKSNPHFFIPLLSVLYEWEAPSKQRRALWTAVRSLVSAILLPELTFAVADWLSAASGELLQSQSLAYDVFYLAESANVVLNRSNDAVFVSSIAPDVTKQLFVTRILWLNLADRLFSEFDWAFERNPLGLPLDPLNILPNIEAAVASGDVSVSLLLDKVESDLLAVETAPAPLAVPRDPLIMSFPLDPTALSMNADVRVIHDVLVLSHLSILFDDESPNAKRIVALVEKCKKELHKRSKKALVDGFVEVSAAELKRLRKGERKEKREAIYASELENRSKNVPPAGGVVQWKSSLQELHARQRAQSEHLTRNMVSAELSQYFGESLALDFRQNAGGVPKADDSELMEEMYVEDDLLSEFIQKADSDLSSGIDVSATIIKDASFMWGFARVAVESGLSTEIGSKPFSFDTVRNLSVWTGSREDPEAAPQDADPLDSFDESTDANVNTETDVVDDVDGEQNMEVAAEPEKIEIEQ
eukprot:ANDGO_00897.mRNA.1 hypothetical protein